MPYWRDDEAWSSRDRWRDPLLAWDDDDEVMDDGIFLGDAYGEDEVDEVLSALDDLMQVVADFGFEDLSERLGSIYCDFETRVMGLAVTPQMPIVQMRDLILPKTKAVVVKARPRAKKGA